MKMFQTPTQNLIAASATYCLYWKKKENKRNFKVFWAKMGVASLSYTYNKMLWQKVLKNMELSSIAHVTCAERSLPLQIWLCFCHSFLSSTWEVQKLWSSERRCIYRDTLVWVPFSCTDSLCGFQESKIQTWNTLSFLCRDEFPVSLQSNKSSDVGEKQWWVHTIWNFKPTNFHFLPLPVIGCSTLRCVEMFTECLEWWQNLFLC